MLNTHRIIVVAFLVTNKVNQVKFSEEIFMVAIVSPEVVFEILFLTLSGAHIDFLDWKLRWRINTTIEALLTTRRVKLVGKKEFAVAALNPKHETFVVHVSSFNSTLLDIHHF